VANGERESTGSWAELLRDLRRRGMQAPVVAVADSGLGLWAALRDVFSATRQQRDWVHKLANVLSCLPTVCQAGRAQGAGRDPGCARPRPRSPGDPGVCAGLWRQVAQGGHQDHRRCRGAVVLLRRPGRALAAPEGQQPIESTFASVRLRTRVTKALASQGRRAAMAFKLLEATQDCWRAVTAPTWSHWCGLAHGSTRG
jgi:putative transposase